MQISYSDMPQKLEDGGRWMFWRYSKAESFDFHSIAWTDHGSLQSSLLYSMRKVTLKILECGSCKKTFTAKEFDEWIVMVTKISF